MPKEEKKKDYKIEMFRSGTHTDSSGSEKVWTNEELDGIATKYNESAHEAPVVIGHPKHNDPAVGWVDSVKREGNKLFGNLKNMNNDFVEAWKGGSFKKRSISLYPDGTIRHLGFLGAMPPAIKGLSDFQFAESIEGEEFSAFEFEDSFDYMDWEEASLFRQIGRTFQNIREYFIDKNSVEVADGLIPTFIIDDLKGAEATTNDDNSFSEPDKKEGDTMTPEEKQRLETAENSVASLTKSNTDFQETITGLNTKVTTLEASASAVVLGAVTKDFTEFCDGLVSKGLLKPADKDGQVNQLLLAHNADGVAEFAEGDEEKKGAVAFLKNSLSKAPKIVDFNESETDDDLEDEKDPNKLAEKATEFQEAQAKLGKTISYTEAVNTVASRKVK